MNIDDKKPADIGSFSKLCYIKKCMNTKQIDTRIRKLEHSLTQLRRKLIWNQTIPHKKTTDNEAQLANTWKAPAALQSLRKKLPKDPVAWQRKIRSSWK